MTPYFAPHNFDFLTLSNKRQDVIQVVLLSRLLYTLSKQSHHN